MLSIIGEDGFFTKNRMTKTNQQRVRPIVILALVVASFDTIAFFDIFITDFHQENFFQWLLISAALSLPLVLSCLFSYKGK